MSSETKSKVLYHNLDTSFVNLWALLRKLSRDGFIGRVRVELKDYAADVFMNGSSTPLVREVDRAVGTETLEESALHRVVLRTRESPGSISIFEGADEATVSVAQAVTAPGAVTGVDQRNLAGGLEASSMEAETVAVSEAKAETESRSSAMVKASGELISAVERALAGSNVDFASIFETARVELADDYPFLDPTANSFQYANSEVKLRDELTADIYVTGLSEVLRRVVNKAAGGDRARRVRERVALELALVARKRDETLKRSGFHDQLHRIAGTKVI